MWHATLKRPPFPTSACLDLRLDCVPFNGALRLQKLSFRSLSRVKPDDIYNFANQDRWVFPLISQWKHCKASVSERSTDWRQSDLLTARSTFISPTLANASVTPNGQPANEEIHSDPAAGSNEKLHLGNISIARVWDGHLNSLGHVTDASSGRGRRLCNFCRRLNAPQDFFAAVFEAC